MENEMDTSIIYWSDIGSIPQESTNLNSKPETLSSPLQHNTGADVVAAWSSSCTLE